jgi:thiamine-monophosphate kinase
MDVSDGLAGDLAKMLRASSVSAEVAVADVPLSGAARAAVAAAPDLLTTVLTGGDDYEILCAVPPDRVASLRAEAQAAGVPLTPIGRVTEGSAAPRFLDPDGTARNFAFRSFSHF